MRFSLRREAIVLERVAHRTDFVLPHSLVRLPQLGHVLVQSGELGGEGDGKRMLGLERGQDGPSLIRFLLAKLTLDLAERFMVASQAGLQGIDLS